MNPSQTHIRSAFILFRKNELEREKASAIIEEDEVMFFLKNLNLDEALVISFSAHGRRSLSLYLKEFEHEIERTLKTLRAENNAWDLFENLCDNPQQHATSLRVDTSREIGNRGGMYEVSQIVDLSLKIDVLSKEFDQLLPLNTLPTNSPNVQDPNFRLTYSIYC
ncbi:hypothetical protein M9H77_11031 [Catharanthus roseus]|uniref:Uncharacterized protein n=1 Tax=Catharanthus roseus TaxID=4058 RepID=A0ACC0BDF5_CATRO|nr:hypothetical protein M9H77_11031 [Catharanthus roseus]